MIKGPSLFQPKELKKKRKERKWGLTQLESNSTQINWVVLLLLFSFYNCTLHPIKGLNFQAMRFIGFKLHSSPSIV